MVGSFVLSELRPFLNVSQNRLETERPFRRQGERVTQNAWFLRKPNAADMQFWPRVEIVPAFVLSELQPFLYIGLCRIEMQAGSSKLRVYLELGRLGLMAGIQPESGFGEAFDDILF
jgi:hypothetical protein